MLKIKPKRNKKNILTWNVLAEDINRKEVVSHNIFDHVGFVKDLVEDLKNLEKNEKVENFRVAFTERIKSNLMYYYESKAEWEVVVTSWPPYTSLEEVDKANNEIERYEKEYGHKPYIAHFSPAVGEKVDVYDQVMLNWNMFVEYVLDHTKELKKLANNYKKGIYE